MVEGFEGCKHTRARLNERDPGRCCTGASTGRRSERSRAPGLLTFAFHALNHSFELVHPFLELVSEVLVSDCFIDAAVFATGFHARAAMGLVKKY